MKELSQTSHSYQEHFDQVVKFYDIEKSSRLADLVSGLSLANRDDLQALLCITSVRDRLEKVMELMQHDLEMRKIPDEPRRVIEQELAKLSLLEVASSEFNV